MNKLFKAFGLAICMTLVPVVSFGVSEKDFSISVNDQAEKGKSLEKEEISSEYLREYGEELLREYWLSGQVKSYEDFKEKYLYDKNDLFNEEIKIRFLYMNKKAEAGLLDEDYDHDELEFLDPISIEKIDDYYLLRTTCNRNYCYKKDDGSFEKYGSDPRELTLKLQVIDGRVYLTDFVGDLSDLFNKENKYQAKFNNINLLSNDKKDDLEKENEIDYAWDISKNQNIIDESDSYSKEELKKIQMKNLELIKKDLLSAAEENYKMIKESEDIKKGDKK